MRQSAPSGKATVQKVLAKIRRLVGSYLVGMLLVIALLACVYSLGLWLIGLPNPLFWGSMAAILAIIPYIGTFIGGLLPFVYALLFMNSFWQPIAVVALFVIVQQIEGNFITPKVVGDRVDLNPLAAILALFVWAFIWGIGGMIIALPLTAILKILCDHSYVRWGS